MFYFIGQVVCIGNNLNWRETSLGAMEIGSSHVREAYCHSLDRRHLDLYSLFSAKLFAVSF